MFSANELPNMDLVGSEKSARIMSPDFDQRHLAMMLSCSALPLSVSSRGVAGPGRK